LKVLAMVFIALAGFGQALDQVKRPVLPAFRLA